MIPSVKQKGKSDPNSELCGKSKKRHKKEMRDKCSTPLMEHLHYLLPKLLVANLIAKMPQGAAKTFIEIL